MEKICFLVFDSDLQCLMIGTFSMTEDEEAFDELFCIAFEMMDAQWLAMHASYMDFNVQSLPLSQSHGK